jgi:superoxide reductase
MERAHHIVFILVETDKGCIRVDLTDEPEAIVCVQDATIIAVYEYCNIHGLWKAEL